MSKEQRKCIFIERSHQKDERCDPVVKSANPRLSVGGCTPWSSTRHKTLESPKIMEHFELHKLHTEMGGGGRVGVAIKHGQSDWEADHRIQLLESYS